MVGLDCGYEFLSRSAMVMEHAMGTRYRGYFQLLLKREEMIGYGSLGFHVGVCCVAVVPSI